ncbi:MAG: Smr/MutS family protein [Rhodobiaceae bacterium]|nr:Smr/MutS family protein [Rhodobiaceae bacterium]MCC0055433.1 Smr/MutS family protein [Rhodobiaceae bacterium]
MSGRRGGRDRPGKDDAELWDAVTREVTPLRRRERQAIVAPQEKPDTDTPAPAKKKKVASALPAYRPVPPSPRVVGPGRIEPRLLRKMSKADGDIDAVIDLHGMRQDAAHMALDRFIKEGAARGFRLVMVITGKGRSSSEGMGILRQQVPKWLAAPSLAPLVVATAPAHRHRGGEGAIYVQLRRRERLVR